MVVPAHPCVHRFHEWLPRLIIVGAILACISIGLNMSMGEEAADNVANGDYSGLIAPGVAGILANLTFLGTAAGRIYYWFQCRTLAKVPSSAEGQPSIEVKNVDHVSVWIILTFITLAVATLFAAMPTFIPNLGFDVSGTVLGFGIAGGVLALGSWRIAHAALAFGEKTGHYETTYKHLKIPFVGRLFYPKYTGRTGADKLDKRTTKPGEGVFDRNHHHIFPRSEESAEPLRASTKHLIEQSQRHKDNADKIEADKGKRHIHPYSSDQDEDSSYTPPRTKRESAISNRGYRRLSSTSISEINSILSILCVALGSLFVWFLFFKGKGESIQAKPRQRTTITKKRPTFVKGKRRATHQPTLSTLRSEGNLLAN